MKSIVPAVLVVVLEAGFLFSIASLPGPVEHLRAEVAVVRAAPAPSRAPPASAEPAHSPAPARAPRASRS